MANHRSAIKEHKQNRQARERNRDHRAKLRTAIKRLRTAVTDGDAKVANELLRPTLSLLDRTAKHGAMHDNAAARAKSRLTRAVNGMGAPA